MFEVSPLTLESVEHLVFELEVLELPFSMLVVETVIRFPFAFL